MAISAAGHSNLVLHANGTVTGWGYNYGTNNGVVVPDDLSDVVAISTSGVYNLALHSDGTVTGWGADYNGEFELTQGSAGFAISNPYTDKDKIRFFGT